jgi:hypothetical protein
MRNKILKTIKPFRLSILLIAYILFTGCKNDKKPTVGIKNIYNCNYDKITFDLNRIPDSGLVGPSDGQVTVTYEFCIPDEKQYIEEIRKISPAIGFMRGSSGRIGCSDKEILCLGSTGSKNFRTTLCDLSKLEYIERIDQCLFE